MSREICERNQKVKTFTIEQVNNLLDLASFTSGKIQVVGLDSRPGKTSIMVEGNTGNQILTRSYFWRNSQWNHEHESITNHV